MNNIVNKRIQQSFVYLHILHHASKHSIYGAWMVEELAEHGYKLSAGTLYPILHNLEKEQLLQSEEINVEGKIRRYYHCTELGKIALEEVKVSLKELVDEILE